MMNLNIDEEKLEKERHIRYNGEETVGSAQLQTNKILLTPLENKVIYLDTVKYFEKRRKRIVLKKGVENIAVLLEHIVFFYTKDKIVYALHNSGKKYIADENLTELESELDKETFFRANRQFIINVNYIKSFRNYERVKLKVDMQPEELNNSYCIIISQDKTSEFRRWIQAA